jgi:membrane protein
MPTTKSHSRVWSLAGYALLALVTIVRSVLPTDHEAKTSSKHPASPTDWDQQRVKAKQVEQSPEPLTSPKAWWSLVRETASGWMTHKAARLGAALAYYSIFSLGPLMLIIIAVAGLIFDQDAVRGQVSSQLTGLLGEQGAKGIEAMLAGAGKPHEGIFATVLGVITLLFAAIGVVVQLKDALNTIWEVEPPSKSGIWSFVRTYAISLAGVLSLGFLLLISLMVTTALSAMGSIVASYLPEAVFQIVSFIISFSVVSLLFAMMFKWLPDVEIAWRDVLPGAILTAALFEVGKLLIGLYIGKQGLESTYGAAASIVVVLIWVYYSAQLVLFGAEFTRVYAQKYGSTRIGGKASPK